MTLGRVRLMGGGVGRNIAEALAKIGSNHRCSPRLLSAVGNDNAGQLLLQLTSSKVDCSRVRVEDTSSACCVVVIDNMGENVLLVGDMSIHSRLSHNYISNNLDNLKNSSIVVFDGNLPEESMNYIINVSAEYGKPVWFEPADVVTAGKAFKTDSWKKLNFISPNVKELHEILITLGLASSTDEIDTPHKMSRDDVIEKSFRMAKPLAEHIGTVMVTLGKHGIMMVGRESDNGITGRYYHLFPHFKLEVASVSGAGDCSAAGFITGWLSGMSESSCMSMAFAAAADSLQCLDTVPTLFCTEPDKIAKNMSVTLITS